MDSCLPVEAARAIIPHSQATEELMEPHLKAMGMWGGGVLAVFGVIYMGLVTASMISAGGFLPGEPYQTFIHILVMVMAAWMVFLWAVLHRSAPAEKKAFSLTSFGMVAALAALTTINRYVALTVVRRSSGPQSAPGLQWFLPYSWPSVMLAIEILAWGFFLGLACLSLAPVFRRGHFARWVFWTLLATGLLSLCAAVAQIVDSAALSIAGLVGWGPGLTSVAVLMALWFRHADGPARAPAQAASPAA
jgi:hypothetical protein